MKSDDARLRPNVGTHEVGHLRQSEGQGTSPRCPALRSWLKNCLVPVLVDQYLAEQGIKTAVALGHETVRDSTERSRESFRCNVQ